MLSLLPPVVRRARRLMVVAAISAWIATGLVAAALVTGTPPAAAADLSRFNPGNIISDQVFFNSGTMTEGEIQAFLNSKGGSCSGSMCLKNYTDTVPAKAGDAFCAGYPASGQESAARILYRVATSCGINPQVLLVTLQKEQSLVTRTNATAATYQKAMGFGCPDTAACDSTYYGFGNQLYSAARQFQRYANSGQYTWVKVGQVNDVRYHPNVACGTRQVYIENRATAGLYYYTPYTPNQAALNAGYGTGDGCSAYGNRNFYQYFTDWFGDTQATASIVQTSGDPRVWLVSGTTKNHIGDAADLMVLTARLGWVRQVPQSYLNSLTTGGTASRYVHDPRTGTLYLLQKDGTKHGFPTADLVARYGYEFNSYVNLSSSQIDSWATGANVGNFFRIEDAPEVYAIDGSTRRYITTPRALSDRAGSTTVPIMSMATSGAQKLGAGPAVLERRALFSERSGQHVYVALDDTQLLHIPSFALASEAGAVSHAVVADSTLASNSIVPGSLSPFVRCGSQDYLLAGGSLRPVTGSGRAGFTPTSLPAAACAAFPIATNSVSAPFFVQAPGRPEVYVLEAGQLHHVRTAERLNQLNGSRPLTVLSWSTGTVSWVGVGGPELGGTFVQFEGQGEVYQGNGRDLRHVTTYDALLRLNGGRVPSVERLPAAQKSYYTVGAPIS